MSYQHIHLPEQGEKISVKEGRLHIPDNPIVGYVEGDGIGPDITRAMLRVLDSAVNLPLPAVGFLHCRIQYS